MRKLSLLLALVLALTVFMIPAAAAEVSEAAEPRMSSVVPGLSVKVTTAYCSATINGNTTSDYIRATMRLYQGNTLIDTWTDSGYGYLVWSRTKTITPGYTYYLEVDAVIGGVTFPTSRVSAS